MTTAPETVELAAACAEQGSARGIDTDLGWGLGVVFRGYVKAANEVFAGLPGGARGFQILTLATGGQGPTQVQLAQHLGIDRTVMTYLLDDLEGEGLVERRPDPADRRARRIVATPVGEERLTVLIAGLEHAEEHVLAGLEPGDRAVFRVLLQRLATSTELVDRNANPCVAVEESVAAEASGTTAPRRRRR